MIRKKMKDAMKTHRKGILEGWEMEKSNEVLWIEFC